MKARPLADIQVLDLTHRLPGPLAGHLLQEMGAVVTKVEDEKFGDPFLDGFFKEMDPSFSLWYQAINKEKKIERFNLKEENQKLLELAQSSDIILMGLPPKIQTLYGLDFESLSKTAKRPYAMISMTATHEQSRGMHDLNALALNRLIDLHVWEMTQNHQDQVVAPPFLPIAGIGFGSILASQALGHLLKARAEGLANSSIISLEESVQALWAPFYSEELQKSGQKRFLHNGRYPCYNIYRLKGGAHLAVASLEPKYWARFCTILELPLTEEERFSLKDTPQGEKVFSQITKKCQELDGQGAKKLFQAKDCCVDVIMPL